MAHKYMTADECYKSFRAYESTIEKQIKEGTMPINYAKALLTKAKKNYKNQNYNRELDKMK